MLPGELLAEERGDGAEEALGPPRLQDQVAAPRAGGMGVEPDLPVWIDHDLDDVGIVEESGELFELELEHAEESAVSEV